MLAEDFLGMGARFVDIDPSLGVLPSKHTTYKSQIMKAPDAETYTFGTNIPRTIMLRKIDRLHAFFLPILFDKTIHKGIAIAADKKYKSRKMPV